MATDYKTYTVKQSFQDGGSENYEYIAYEYAFISKKDYVNSNDAGYEMVEDMFDWVAGDSIYFFTPVEMTTILISWYFLPKMCIRDSCKMHLRTICRGNRKNYTGANEHQNQSGDKIQKRNNMQR